LIQRRAEDIREKEEALQKKIRDGDEAVKSTQLLIDFGKQAEEAAEFARTNSDPDTHVQVFNERLGNIQAGTVEGAAGLSVERRQQFDQRLMLAADHYQKQAYRQSLERKKDAQLAGAFTALDDLATMAAKEPEPEGVAVLSRIGGETIGDLVRNGALGEDDAAKMRVRMRDKIVKDRADYFSTGLEAELDDFRNQAFRLPANAGDLFERGKRRIVQAGKDWLAPEKVDAVIRKFRDSLFAGAVKSMIKENPERTLADLKAGDYDDRLAQASLEDLTGEAETEIERRQRRAEAERKERERHIGKLVTDYKDAKMAGFEWAGNEADLAAKVRGTEHEADFLAVRSASRVLGKFNQLAPVQQEAFLRTQGTQPMSGEGAKFYNTLQAAHQRTKTALKDDPLTFAIRQRVVDPLPPLDFNNPATLRQRSQAASIAEQHYQVPVSPLSDEEADVFRQALDKAPPEKQTQMLRGLKAGLEDRQVKSIAAQLAKKNDLTLAQAIGLSVDSPQAATEILQGRKILTDNPKVLPEGADMRSLRDRINRNLGAAYAGNPQHHAAVTDAAMKIYANRLWKARTPGVFDDTLIDESVDAATGGLIKYQGEMIQPPRPGMTDAEFRRALDRANYSKAAGFSKAEILKHGTLESVGDARYLVRVGPGYVQGDKGPFVLDLSARPAADIGAAIGLEILR
jgi:hypothetical protein